MLGVLMTLIGGALALSALAAVAALGFRDGDHAGDPTVDARLQPTSEGAWIEVRIENPGVDVVLVGAQIVRRRWPLGSAPQRGAGRSRRVRLAEQVIGAVRPGDRESLWLFAEGALKRWQLVTTIGIPGRLRIHRIALSSLGLESNRAAERDRFGSVTAASAAVTWGRKQGHVAAASDVRVHRPRAHHRAARLARLSRR